jgi:hypothetical protein
MPPTESASSVLNEVLEAIGFAERRFVEWQEKGRLSAQQLVPIRERYETLSRKAREADQAGSDPTIRSLPRAMPNESPTARSLRYWIFMKNEIERFAERRELKLAQSHDLIAEVKERLTALERKLGPDELPEVIPVAEGEAARASYDDFVPKPPPKPRQPAAVQRNMLEILLDPRNIQWLLVFGGALMVLGLVILLWVREFFTSTTVAAGLGTVNLAVLGLGWFVMARTRYHTAGRALTLLACLVMPLNLWYYDSNGLITVANNLWMPALVMCVLYFVSALLLKDEAFVYVFCAGVTMSGLLILAGIAPSPEKFWEIASPATMLVLLGIAGIHLERAFPDAEGPFGRKRFGMAFFWSGQLQLLAGLLLLLGATIAGDWLFAQVFQPIFAQYKAEPSPIVLDPLRWLAILLVAAATYAYIYSDLVVRHAGFYVYVAAATLLWLVVLLIEEFQLKLGIEAFIAVLSGLALAINLAQGFALKDSKYTRALPILGVFLPLLAVVMGVAIYLRHVSPDLQSSWALEKPTWAYLGAMVLTAISCRVGAWVYRTGPKGLSAVYFFATGAATLTAAAALLVMLGLGEWQQHGPILMLLPIIYLVSAHLYKGNFAEYPLEWVAHAATGVLLISALASAFNGFTMVEKSTLNLSLALFFLEVAVFYGLSAGLRRSVIGVHLCALMACAAVWQLFTYAGVSAEVYTLVFAIVGIGLLLGYRLALVERLAGDPLANAAFQAGNVLLSLSFIAAALMSTSRLVSHRGVTPEFIWLCAGLTVISLVAVGLVRQMAWRRWYVVTTIGQAGLTFLCVTMLSRLTPMEKVEAFCVAVGTLLLLVSHVGWYAEQDRESDLVSLGLVIGSLMVGVPLAIATLIDRSRGDFLWYNEFGFLLAGVLLLTTGFLFQLKSTTIIGAFLTVLYLMTLLIRINWDRVDTVAVVLTAGGGGLFLLGLVLSVFRERLLTMPERIHRREGVFRVLNWR